MKITKLFLLTLTFTGLLFLRTQAVKATVMIWEAIPTNEYGVRITFASNHGYEPHYKSIMYLHASKGLAEARNRLVDAGKIEDEQVLFMVPSSVFQIIPENTQISLEADCKLPEGGSGLEPKSIGRCYKVHYVGEDDYNDFLTVLTSLSTLRAAYVRSIDNIEAEKILVEDELKSLQGIKRYFDPVWSPNGKYVVFTFWEDGNVGYSIQNSEGREIDFVGLDDGYPMNSPLWSPDSKYLAVASLNSVGLYNVESGSWKEITLPERDGKTVSNLETLISFDPTNNRLLISRDLSVLFDYELLAHDLATEEITDLGTEHDRPEWGNDFNGNDYLYKTKATSPNGMYEAAITKVYLGNSVIEGMEVKKSVPGSKPAEYIGPPVKVSDISDFPSQSVLVSDMREQVLKTALVVLAIVVVMLIVGVVAFVVIYKKVKSKPKEQEEQNDAQQPLDTQNE